MLITIDDYEHTSDSGKGGELVAGGRSDATVTVHTRCHVCGFASWHHGLYALLHVVHFGAAVDGQLGSSHLYLRMMDK